MLYELQKLGAGRGIQWPAFNVLLLKRLFDAEFISAQQPMGTVRFFGMDAAPLLLTITQAGQKFLEEIQTDDIT